MSRRCYKVIGAYDSETTNIVSNGIKKAFPVTHQIGVIDCDISEVTADNIESHTEMHVYRHALELYDFLDSIVMEEHEYTPVIAVHNLGFDMYGLSCWLASWAEKAEVQVTAKSARKPIAFKIVIDDVERLVVWDTLVFSQKSLAYMGEACGYKKLAGEWDYDLVRTPETRLTPAETAYATHDVYTLLAWLGYWCRLNPDIDAGLLGGVVMTKTGVVRRRRLAALSGLKPAKGKQKVSRMWHTLNESERFKDDDELFSCVASTRGGYTFCASEHASQVYDLPEDGPLRVAGYDATSQHPAQIVSHKYPVGFSQVDSETMQAAFDLAVSVTPERMLECWAEPFFCAFHGRFDFSNLRPKKRTVFSRNGVYPLASARLKVYRQDAELSQDSEDFKAYISEQGYKDTAVNAHTLFGKLVSAEHASLYLTELAAWEVAQVYEWDSMVAHEGYAATRWTRPTDLAVLSVMRFYKAKADFKKARGEYYKCEHLSDIAALRGVVPDFVLDGMDDGTIDSATVEATYLGLKADLNALFGIEATNEYRRDTVLGLTGIEYDGDFGVSAGPKSCKAWYQMGQRIVGWSRVAQTLVMELLEPYVVDIINGDTDSIKVLYDKSNEAYISEALQRYADALTRAKQHVCARVRRGYPQQFDPLESIGAYVKEFEVAQFCAAWNKAYAMRDADGIHMTLAGVPLRRGIEDMASAYADEHGFKAACDVFLGYNVTYLSELTGLSARAFPEWCAMYVGDVTDYRGVTSHVAEPAALCLYDMPKTVNDDFVQGNKQNMEVARQNNPEVNTDSLLVGSDGIVDLTEVLEQ